MALVGALALQWPLGWLSDVVDRRLVIAGAIGLGVLAAAGLMAEGPGAARLLVLGVLLGGLVMPADSLWLAHAYDRIEGEDVVSASSALILV
jgi:MFS family permease